MNAPSSLAATGIAGLDDILGGGEHERSIRELSMKGGRISVGEPLRDYGGVLSGVPQKKSRP